MLYMIMICFCCEVGVRTWLLTKKQEIQKFASTTHSETGNNWTQAGWPAKPEMALLIQRLINTKEYNRWRKLRHQSRLQKILGGKRVERKTEKQSVSSSPLGFPPKEQTHNNRKTRRKATGGNNPPKPTNGHNCRPKSHYWHNFVGT